MNDNISLGEQEKKEILHLLPSIRFVRIFFAQIFLRNMYL